MIKSIKTKLSLLFCIVTGLLFVLAEQSCVHKERNGPYASQVEECTPTRDSVLQWYRFKTGTYWVYQEAAAGLLDSIRVNSHIDTVYANGLFEFSTNTHSYLNGENLSVFYQSTDEYESFVSPPCRVMPIWVDRIVSGSVTESRVFFYPFNAFEYSNHVAFFNGTFFDGTTRVQNEFAQMNIAGIVFHNVVRLKVTGDIMNEGRTTIYDFAKNIGIIRKSQLMADSTWRDWNLVRYTILQ